MPKPAKTQRSLAQFARDKKRVGCAICGLPDSVRKQLREASKRSYPRRPDVLAWLNDVVGVKIDESDLLAHTRGRHDSL